MQPQYVINVARPNGHFFRVIIEGHGKYDEARECYQEICKRFPESEGFRISVMFWQVSGRDVTGQGIFKL